MEPLAAWKATYFLVNDALRRRQEGGVHDDREHLRVRGVGAGWAMWRMLGVFEDALAGGEGVVLVFHVVPMVPRVMTLNSSSGCQCQWMPARSNWSMMSR